MAMVLHCRLPTRAAKIAASLSGHNPQALDLPQKVVQCSAVQRPASQQHVSVSDNSLRQQIG